MNQFKQDDRITKLERETLQQINDLESKVNQKITKSMDAVFTNLIPEYFNNLRQPFPFIDQNNFNEYLKIIQNSILDGEKDCRKYYEELFYTKNEANSQLDNMNQKIQEIQKILFQIQQSNLQNNEIQNLQQRITQLEGFVSNFSNLDNYNKYNYQLILEQQKYIQELQNSHSYFAQQLKDLPKQVLQQQQNNQQQKFDSQEIKDVIQKYENIKNTQELFIQELNQYKQNEANFKVELDKMRNEFDEIRSKYSDINNQLLNIDSILKKQDLNQKFEQTVQTEDQKNINLEFKPNEFKNEKDKIQIELNDDNQQNNQQQQIFQGNQQWQDQRQSNIKFQQNFQNTNFQKFPPQQANQNNFSIQQNNQIQFKVQNQNQQFNFIPNQNQKFGQFQTNQQQRTQTIQPGFNNQVQQQSQILFQQFGNQNQQKPIPKFNTSKEVQGFINQIYDLTSRIRSAQGYQQQFVKECQSFQEFKEYYQISINFKRELIQLCSGFRQVRGDGNCFYTAFGFQVLQIVLMEYNDQQFNQIINSMEELIQKIGFEIRFNENKENNPELGKKLYQEFIQRIKYFRSHSIQEREQLFIKHFQQYEQDKNDELNDGCLYAMSCIYFRNLANYLVQNSEMKDQIYDKETLLEWEKECNCNEVVILILVTHLNMKCRLLFMEKDNCVHRIYNEEGTNQIILLIKPGHYNIGIPVKPN